MLSNTFTPIVGGVEKSIRTFTEQFRREGHQVLIVAPEFDGMPKGEREVVRVPAIRRFNGSDFSVRLPIPVDLFSALRSFKPDIVHSHHPFMLGDTALRIAKKYRVPLVFTYHTKYEDYTHYVPLNSPALKRFVVELSTGYANLADRVFVPSESIAELLRGRHVRAPMDVIPTGLDLEAYHRGDRERFRSRWGLAADAFIIGHVGRMAPEKNLLFLSEAVLDFLRTHERGRFLAVGKGPVAGQIKTLFQSAGMEDRLCLTGTLEGQELIDAYHAMDVFAFASKTETQGLVVTEALAAGTPVVALDASGAREVVLDKENGRLLKEENIRTFSSALQWVYGLGTQEYQALKKKAWETVQPYSIQEIAQKVLGIYQSLRNVEFIERTKEESLWEKTLAQIRTEWDLVKNLAEAAGAAFSGGEESFSPGGSPAGKSILNTQEERWMIKLKRWLSHHEWSARILGLSQSQDTGSQPGLVLIQIDGFSMTQLNRALTQGEMPFLKKLLRKERYRLYRYYSGLPSSTPSVQGELFYGVKMIVPSFSFRDHQSGKVFRLYDQPAALEIERRLAQCGQGLLEGGSSYSNVYSGGAGETHFCAVNIGWSHVWRELNPFRFLMLMLTHLPFIVQTAIQLAVELVLAVGGFIYGISRGENFIKEFKFIVTRLSLCVLLRNLETLGASIDCARGLPVIHLNFIGYDEQAHRRGPSSRFAHWALRGIDKAVARIYSAAIHSTRRRYDVWIYSDHGQEDQVSYAVDQGKTIQQAVAQAFHAASPGPQARKDPVVTAMGPVGHVYLPCSLTPEERYCFIRYLVDKAHVPVVLMPGDEGRVTAWSKEGEWVLPEETEKIAGVGHPYLAEIREDLTALCHHPDAGDFTILGWRLEAKPVSFPVENGSHAGPGTEETNAFAILPPDILSLPESRAYMKTMDLREAALRFLKPCPPPRPFSGIKVADARLQTARQVKDFKSTRTLRILTYNVHSCVGLDGKISPERIARVIARHEPDIVALQELDMRRPRTGEVDQPHTIAQYLEMIYHFHPAIQIEEEQYGDAILSRYPMRLIRSEQLPDFPQKPHLEPRGALWVAIDLDEKTRVQVLNTHLGLRRGECLKQAQALTGPEWLSHPDCQGPVILCGDLNALPGSAVCRCFSRKLRDAQTECENHRPKATWFSRLPIGRIDHIFVSPELEVTRVEVSDTDLDKAASDHLPLVVDVRIK